MKKLVSLLTAVIVVALSAVTAMAAPSPVASKELNVTVINTQGGSASYTVEYNADGEYVTLTANPKDKYQFSGWVIDGEYDIIEGTLQDETIVIRLKSDIKATPKYVKKGTGSTSTGSEIPVKSSKAPQGSASRNSSATSPKTGDTAVYFMFGALAVLAAASVAVGVKLVCSNKK